MARLGLAAGKGAEGIKLAQTVDAGVRDALRRAAAEPTTKVLVEGTAAPSLAGARPAAHATPVGSTGMAGVAARQARTSWLVTPGTPRTLASLRAVDELRASPAVQPEAVPVVDPALFTPSPDAAGRLAALVAFLHPGAVT